MTFFNRLVAPLITGAAIAGFIVAGSAEARTIRGEREWSASDAICAVSIGQGPVIAYDSLVGVARDQLFLVLVNRPFIFTGTSLDGAFLDQDGQIWDFKILGKGVYRYTHRGSGLTAACRLT